jgi:hypothetical protein
MRPWSRAGVRWLAAVLSAFCPLAVLCQTSEPAAQQTEILEQLRLLSVSLEKTQEQLSQSQAEIRELRAKIDAMEGGRSVVASATAATASQTLPEQGETSEQQAPPAKANISEDDWQVMNERVAELQQTKVESASKFRVKLSGLLLLNAFTANGRAEQIDVPEIVVPSVPGFPSGYSGASVRQSILGVSGYGPDLLGAHTSGDVQMDFFGGLENTYYGMTGGIARLRIARLRFDWKNTSIIGGLDTPLFSPLSPTSYMTVAEPALSAAGNMWTWTPQVRVEHRFEFEPAQLKVEAGLLDPISVGAVATNYLRLPTPGESSRQPAYALRLSAGNKNEERPLVIGVGGFYSPQQFPYGYVVHNWASTLDWQIGLLRKLELSGEFFIGKGMEGFGGVSLGLTPPTNYYNYVNVTLPGLDELTGIGGWGQLKYRVNTRSEFNAAGGYGGLNSTGLRALSTTSPDFATIPARNQTFLANYILRPRSDLLFSVEYRHLRTFNVTGAPNAADVVGLAAGFLF